MEAGRLLPASVAVRDLATAQTSTQEMNADIHKYKGTHKCSLELRKRFQFLWCPSQVPP